MTAGAVEDLQAIQDHISGAGRGQNSDLIPKLVTGLLAHRKAGHWLNTQENAFVLMALALARKRMVAV